MAKKMTSKERVRAAFSHQEPDRVPIDYAANAAIDGRLKAHFGLKPNDGEGLCEALHVDFRFIGPVYTGPRLHPELPDRAVDQLWGIRTRWIEHESGGYWDFCDFPLQHATLEDVENWPMPSPDDYDYSTIADRCAQFSQYGIVHGFMPDVINWTGMLRTMEQTLVDLITGDPIGLRLVDRKLAIGLEITRRTLEAAKGRIDILLLGEDLGTQIAPMISLDLFRREIRPRHQPFVDLARHFGVHAMEHTCGSSSWAYDDFIAMGIAAVDTLQPEAVDMAPAHLKKRFGDRLTFHGCISTAGQLAYGCPDDVTANVRETLEIMKPGGGYALAPTHAIQDNSPTANVVAMYEAALKFGLY